MSWTRFFRRRYWDEERERELEAYVETETDENIARGMTPEEARYAAHRKLGNTTLIREEIYHMNSLGWVETFWPDLRYGLRMLGKNRGVTAVAVLSLALGIGANSTIFSIVNAYMFRPLPYERPNELVSILETDPNQRGAERQPPIANANDWKNQNHVFENVAVTSFTEPSTLAGLGEPERINVQYASPELFYVLHVKPALGRIFTAEEVGDHAQSVVISDSFWKRHFNRDPRVLGKTFRIWGAVSTVVGVMPPGFAPFFGGSIDLWEPINPASSRYARRNEHWLMAVARLKSGISLQQAQLEMDVIAHRLAEAYPAANKGVGTKVILLHDALFRGTGQVLYLLLGAVGFVLLVACTNVANLLLARMQTRQKELAVRRSLGAGRGRLIRQLLVESGLLGFFGGCLGILLTVEGIKLFILLLGEFPNSDNIGIDGRVLLFTLCITLLTVMISGLAPAIQASKPDLVGTLKEASHRSSAGPGGRTRQFLVISEVALALVLLVGAGLMVNSLLRLRQDNPGFNPRNLITMEVHLMEGGRYVVRPPVGNTESATPAVTAFFQQVLQRVALLPGVASVGMNSMGWMEPRSFAILGHPAPGPDDRPFAGYSEVSPGFFATLQIPLKKGRFLDERDTATAPWAVVINETLARRYFPNENPLGQEILMRWEDYHVDEPRPRVVVGVVGDTKRYLGEDLSPFAYASYLQQPVDYPGGRVMAHIRQQLVIRLAAGHRGGAGSLASEVKRVVTELDPDQPLTAIETMDQILAESTGDTLFFVQLFGIFAGIALALAIVGIYGVMSYIVTERTHEIGIRVALGARRPQVLGLVVKLGLKLTLIGVAAGVTIAIGLTRLIARLLYGVKPTDPLTLVAVSLVLTGTALLACYLPARRATKVDPMVALRHE